jgi:hypothetical protein
VRLVLRLAVAVTVLAGAAVPAAPAALAAPARPAEPLPPEQQAYLADRIAQARSQRLWEERFWRLLLHYRADTLGGGLTSEADGPGFFLSPDGKSDPQAELEATLRAFYSREPIPPANMTPQCTFPARLRWLEERLGLHPARLPRQPCEDFEQWRARVDPESVSLIFASHYFNNPASMFGHTLLRFNKKGRAENVRLLDYAINYAASVTPGDNDLVYAWRGLFGGYFGYFSMMPYYLKVKEYNDVESRDLWEYRLNFTPGQLDYMLRHTWEMGSTYYEYYFFKENCSYHLLSLLEVANPALHLTDDYALWTMPSETVQQIARQPGLVDKVIYRPSQSSRMARKLKTMTNGERGWVGELIDDPSRGDRAAFLALPPERRALAIDAAIDFYQYKLAGKTEGQETRKAGLRALLLQRSRLPPLPEPKDDASWRVAPDRGHDSARAGIAGGATRALNETSGMRENDAFGEVSIQAAFHDLLSRDVGYAPNSQINLLHLRGRYEAEAKEWRLERFALVDLVSLFPLSTLIRQPSWRFEIGWQRNRDLGCEQCTPFFLRPGIGLALQTELHRREVYFALLEGSYEYDREFVDHHRAGFGLTAGFLVDLNEDWRVGLIGTRTRYTEGQRGSVGQAQFRLRFSLSRNLEINLDWSGVEDVREGKLGLGLYF